MTDTAQLRALLAKMTQGEWERLSTEIDGVFIVAGNLGGLVAAALPWPTEIDSGDFSRVEANAAGIVALVNAAPAMLDELERLRAIEAIAKRFCERVEAGQVRSVTTYNAFRTALGAGGRDAG